MKTEALIWMLSTQLVVATITSLLIYKVLRSDKKVKTEGKPNSEI